MLGIRIETAVASTKADPTIDLETLFPVGIQKLDRGVALLLNALEHGVNIDAGRI